MTYEEAMLFINNSSIFGCDLGLDSIIELLYRLDNPQEKLKVIHIGGTNGKGSTGAFLSSILAKAGYKVGRYISPAVFEYKEIIQIYEDNIINYISEDGIIECIKLIKDKCDKMLDEGYKHPTKFEIETAMAFLYLLKEGIDILVLEVGLGGRLDATNVLNKPLCSVFTSISLDHMDYLGNTIEEITREKAAIIKKDSCVIALEQSNNVLEILKETSLEKRSKFILAKYNDDKIKIIDFSLSLTKFKIVSQDSSCDYQIQTLGKYQIKNAVLALEVVNYLQTLNYQISDINIKEGLFDVTWPGRFELIAKEPYFIIDGAHNFEASLMLRESLDLYFKDKKIIFIIGVLKDKDYKNMLKNIKDITYKIITVTPKNERALSASDLASEASNYCTNVLISNCINSAIEDAYEGVSENDIIVACGSLSFLKDIKEVVVNKDK